jgi:3-phenylpropionate/trans-cinnamate dioxygenase ferredoxin reductase component
VTFDDPGAMVIVGAGQAGGVAAVTLREEGFRGRVVLIGQEEDAPFGRPPLSKTYLRGEETIDGWLVKPGAWYAQHDVELLTGVAAQRIDTAGKQVVLDDGRTLPYGKLLLATGGRHRRLGVPGADLPGVYVLRTRAECDALKAAAHSGRQAVIVGMGYIGAEVAASLAQMGLQVRAVLSGPAPLARQLGTALAQVLAGIHQEHGVALLPNDRAVAFEGSGRLERVVTAQGARLPCDLAVVGVGIEPDSELARQSGIAVENGILVDEFCRTSAPDVFAAGDVANHLHPVFGRIRVEHYNNAEKQGRAAARSMVGRGEAYRYIHSLWSDQYEHKLEYVGHARDWDQFVLRGSLEERKLLGFYLKAGVLRAAAGWNRGGDPELDPNSELAACATLIARQANLPGAILEDEHVDLRGLASS